MYKFDSHLKTHFAKPLEVLNEELALASDYEEQLVCVANGSAVAGSLLQFARVAIETPPAIMLLIRCGNLSHTYVLLRWYLECAQLCFYLWKNPDQYNRWKTGGEIRPQQVGKFFESIKYESGKGRYFEWSKVSHCDAAYFQHSHLLSAKAQVSDGQLIIVGQSVLELVVLTHRFNFSFGQFLILLLGKRMDALTNRYNALEIKVDELHKNQLRLENEFMK